MDFLQNETQTLPSTKPVVITVWGEDWYTDEVFEVQDERLPIVWTSLPENTQSMLIEGLFTKLKREYPEASFIDEGMSIELPDDYEPVEPTKPFDKRLRKLYSSDFPTEF